ncbi:MAG: hypothetical protein ACP5RH_12740 [Leptodesmis sp.]
MASTHKLSLADYLALADPDLACGQMVMVEADDRSPPRPPSPIPRS